eukprot:700949-Pyramimonas_sp.AAC.1
MERLIIARAHSDVDRWRASQMVRSVWSCTRKSAAMSGQRSKAWRRGKECVSGMFLRTSSRAMLKLNSTTWSQWKSLCATRG